MLWVIFTILSYTLHPPQNKKSIEGAWISREDPNSVVLFQGKRFYEVYQQDTSIHTYQRGTRSCDPTYLDPGKGRTDFLRIDDGRCFEITGITDSSLAYRYTGSGRLHQFYRLANLKSSR